jgi:hypothetical protein
MTPDPSALEGLVARAAIADVLASHSRGVDRADLNLLTGAYHADATVDYGFFQGPGTALAAILAGAQKGQPVTLHRTNQSWVRVEGERATAESYVIAYLETREGGSATQRFVGGRYLDRLAQRGGEWKLSHRTYVMDWNTNRPSTAHWPEPSAALATFGPRGGQGAADPGRALLALGAAGFGRGGTTVSNVPTAQALDAALSRQALLDLGCAYARGVDHADAEALEAIFHEDSAVISGVINGSGREFAHGIARFVKDNLQRCFHSFSNAWFEIRGDDAVGESYVIAHVTAGGQDVMTGGRYLDTYQRRNGTWKFKSRTFVQDWSTTHPTSYQEDGLYETLKTRGRIGPDDPVYDFWKAG